MTRKIINVQPLRTAEEISLFRHALERGNKGTRKRKELADRDLLLFNIGINTGLRVNDILRLKVEDVRETDSVIIYEGKTDKRRIIRIKNLQKQIMEYIKDKEDDQYLFTSQKGENRPISVIQAYRVLNDGADWIGRNDIGTHTMRKTFGYHHYKKFKDVAMLQEIFNHSSPTITKRYIGIREDEINKTLDDFFL